MSENKLIELTAKYINSTNKNIFLTGKAGTGKTTFLRNIAKNTHKNTIVAAPTGIAAINAGGVTLHSLFQLPFGTFIPDHKIESSSSQFEINSKATLIKNLKLNKAKRQLIRSIELLIIDEVSMLRADILDAIDTILKYVNRNSLQFGGIQVLFIGDLLQLPPVVKQNEWNILSNYYSNLYFFNAHALNVEKPLHVELDKVYRQEDQAFIEILNNLRNNELNSKDIEVLNSFYNPNAEINGEAIFITTHNRKADSINKKELEKLEGESQTYKAIVQKEFNDSQFPIDPEITLKKGAKVMFIKNDYSGEQRYFNGKIGTILELDEDGPVVEFQDGTDPFIVEPYTWENKRFKLNKETNEIDTIVKGTFTHLPLKLAWAVTVHKSQGLTFDKAIIDVSDAFAPGQIYVALSRLRYLNGLKLNSPITAKVHSFEDAIVDFGKEKQNSTFLDEHFKPEAWRYLISFTKSAFDLSNLFYEFKNHVESYNKSTTHSKKQQYKDWAINIKNDLQPNIETGKLFIQKLNGLKDTFDEPQTSWLVEKITGGTEYFSKQLSPIIDDIQAHAKEVKSLTGIKTYLKELQALELSIKTQFEKFNKAKVLAISFIENTIPTKKSFGKTEKKKEEKSVYKQEKKPKIPSHQITYEMYKENMSIEDIAIERNVTHNTIENHLSHYIETGELQYTELIKEETFQLIKKAIETLKTYRLNPIKQAISNDYSYSDIKVTIAALKAQKQINPEFE
jgi:nucleoside-triphosphatase THEP1